MENIWRDILFIIRIRQLAFSQPLSLLCGRWQYVVKDHIAADYTKVVITKMDKDKEFYSLVQIMDST